MAGDDYAGELLTAQEFGFLWDIEQNYVLDMTEMKVYFEIFIVEFTNRFMQVISLSIVFD